VNTWLNLDKVKEHYPEAIFVGEFPIEKGSEFCGSVFWQPNPPHDYSNYFMLYICPLRGQVFITSGEKQSTQVYNGIITPNGDFIYSRHRHDYMEHDGCMIDGGDAYLKTNGKGKAIRFIIEGSEIKELD
jgi:hypothetical protein